MHNEIPSIYHFEFYFWRSVKWKLEMDFLCENSAFDLIEYRATVAASKGSIYGEDGDSL